RDLGARGWDLPVLFAGSANGQSRDGYQVRRIFYGSWSSAGDAANGSWLCWDRYRADQFASGYDIRKCQSDARGKLGLTIRGGSGYRTSAGGLRHRGGDGHTSNDVASSLGW